VVIGIHRTHDDSSQGPNEPDNTDDAKEQQEAAGLTPEGGVEDLGGGVPEGGAAYEAAYKHCVRGMLAHMAAAEANKGIDSQFLAVVA